MLKEDNINREEYIIAFCFALLIFFLISEPFVLQITNKEQIRMYGFLLFLIGIIILAKIITTYKPIYNGGEK